MVKVKSMEVYSQNLVMDSIRRAYFFGTKNLNWVAGMTRYSGLRGKKLFEIIDQLEKEYPQHAEKTNALIERCKIEGFL
jgi:DNA topoisomerase IB